MIIKNNELALRMKCEDVFEDEIGTLIHTLENELEHSNSLGENGIGLAAPQIGIAKKIAIIRLDDYNVNLINASIKNMYDPIIFRQEGCLSFPGRIEDTNRFQEIMVSNLNNQANFIATGFLAIACQHEIDHLNEKLFFDYITNKKKITTKIGPNDKCICGSNLKYKRCCGKA